MKKILFLLISIWLSQGLSAQWFHDNIESGATSNTTMPLPWVNTSAACNPPGITNNGLNMAASTIGSGGPKWFGGWNGVDASTAASGIGAAWASISPEVSNTAVTMTYSLSLNGTATISSLTFGVRRNTAAHPNLSVSINGVSQPLSATTLSSTSWFGVTCTPTTPLNLTSGTITIAFRFSGSANTVGMTNRFDELKIFGTVTPTPTCTTPTAFNLTGGGAYCAGGSGVAVGLSNSQSGVNYQLIRSGSNVGSAVSGTGSAISFGNQTVAGSYTVLATTSTGGCTATMTGSATVSVNTNPSPTVSTSTNISCNGGSSGGFTISAGGGTPSYQFNRGTGNQPSGTFSGLAAGSYVVTVTDANGCTGTTGVTLTQPSALIVGVSSSTNIACNGGSSGSFTISASGGTPSYSFNRGTGNQFGGTFSGLTAGAYTVTVTDANGCIGTTSVTITQPSQMSPFTQSQTNIACNGGASGSFTIGASGGTPSYQFNRGAGNQPSGTFSGLAAGSYVVTVTDANGCTGTTGVTLTQPSALIVGVSSSTNIACNGGASGGMSISASGGTPSYSFNRGTGNQLSGTFSGLTAGSYVVTVTDANGCQGTRGVTITQPSALTLTVSSSACGTGTASASGGASSYSYSWNAGTPTGSNVSLAAGTNTVTVIDGNGCQATGSTSVAACNASVTFAVRIPSHLINVTAVDVTGSFVNAAGAGQDWNTGITLSDPDMDGVWTNAGLVSLPPSTAYQYKFRAYNSASPIWESVPNACQVGGNRGFTSAAGGAQVLSTVCFNQCSGTCPTYTPVTFSVHVPYTAFPALTSVDVTGNFMQAAVLGGDFSTGVVLTDPDMDGYYTNATPVYLSAGGSYQYKFRTYTPGQNWENVPGACQVGGNRGFTVASSAQTLPSVCFGECNTSCVNPFSATAAGYDCANNARIYNFSSLGNPAVTPASGSFPAGSHTVTLTNGAGYHGTLTFTSTGYTPATVTASAGAITCAGGESTVTVSAAGGVSPYTGTGSFQRTAGSQTFTVTDAAGCTSSTNINVTEPTALTATANGNAISCFGGNSRVTVTASGGTPSYTGIGSSFFVNAGTYDFTVTDANGCTSVANYNVSQPSMVIVSLSAGTIANNGGTTTVTVTASGGTPAYTGEGTFTRSAGSQSFTVTDANGCSGTNSILLTEPGQLSAATQSGTIACFGGTTQVTVTGVDGTPPYTGTGVFTRSAGSQNFTVTDANGASVVITTFLTQPTQVVASAVAGSISCNGGSTNVTVSATGGTPGYTGEGVVVRAAGSRSFTVTDANGCPATTSINIAQPAVLSIAAATTSCETGSATVTGGTSPFTVTWTNGATGTNVTLAAGSNRATVTDANGCSASSSNITVGSCTVPVTFAVRIPVSMTANVTAVDVTGDFVNAAGLGNNWNAGHSLTDPDMDGVWTSPAAIRLPFSTSYDYKFRAYRTDMGQVWESPTGACINANGNRAMSVPANGSLNIGTVCWQKCTNACPTLVPVNFSVGIPSTMSGVTSVDVTGNWVFDAARGGNWNNALTLTDPDMDGVWTGPTVYVNAGVAYEYKFRSYTASTGPNWEGNIPSPCGNGSNRTFTAPASGTTNLTYCFNTCNTSCPSATVPVNFAVTIPGTMTGVVAVDVTGNWVNVAGLGANFSDGLTLTDPDMDGTWTNPNPVNITSSSTFEYKFRTYTSVGGQANWENIPNACATNGNRTLTTPASGPSTFGPFCFGKCSASCAPPAMVSVTFSVSIPFTMTGITSVDVTGDWVSDAGLGGNWGDALTLTDPDMDGTWTNAAPAVLPANSNYNYKFRSYTASSGPNWENISGGCTAGGNRPMSLPASGTYMAGNYCFGTCNTTCPSATVPVTFSVAIPVSLNGVTAVDVTGNWINAAGLGANWSDGLALTDPDLDGVWTNATPVQLPNSSSFECKFRYYNGNQNWENVPGACATNGNRAFNTPASGPSAVGPFCFGTCNSSCLITFTATPSGVDCANGGQTFVFTASDGDVVTPANGSYAAGNQVVTLTHASGYSNTVSFTSTGYTPFTASISGNGSFCPTTNSNLTAAPSGLSYRWSTSATTQSITVNTAAMFRVTVSDAAGCSSTASLQTTVTDAQAPVISCPANQSLTATGAATLANYISMATASDNCGGVTLTQMPAPGTPYSTSGVVNVTLTARDASANTADCTFAVNITVVPGQAYTRGGDLPCNYKTLTNLGAVPASNGGTTNCFSMLGNNVAATSINDPAGCGAPGDKGVFYTFRMPDCGTTPGIRISTNNAGTALAGTNVAVYTVTNPGSCAFVTYQLVSCSNSSTVTGCSGASGSTDHGTLEFAPGVLENGGSYYIYVSGDNGAEGNFELTFEYIQNGGISVTAGATPGQADVTMPDNGQSQFKVQWRPVGSTGWATSALLNGFSYTLPANTLMPGVSYEFRALYQCAGTNWVLMSSDIVNFATPVTVATCAPVSGLTCNSVSGSVTTTWSTVPVGTSSRVTVALRNGSSLLAGSTVASTVTSVVFANRPTATSMQVQSSCGGAAYIAYSNCAVSAAGQAAAVQPVTFEYNGITYEGIDFNDPQWGLFGAQPEGDFEMTVANGQLIITDESVKAAGFDFELRPSVAMDFTNVVISTQKTVDAQLSLSDINGTLVASQMLKGVQNGTVVTLETSELPAGLYIVSVRTEEGNVAKKLVVVK